MGKIAFIIAMVLMLPGMVLAESSYFRGTQTGWGLTEQVFGDGYYNTHNLFLVIGAKPTTAALHTISGWKSSTTYLQDLGEGVDTFGEQMLKSGKSIPDNASDAGKSVADLFVDPVKEIGDFNLITPATLIFKTVVNTLRVCWNSTMVVAEPVGRVGYGTVALVGAPFVKPVTYTGVAFIYTGTALYGYGSSATAGAVMTAATGTVLALDVATTPAVAVYDAFQPDAAAVKETVLEAEEDEDDAPDADGRGEANALSASPAFGGVANMEADNGPKGEAR